MSIPVWPDWSKLYEQWKCLELGVPFTDAQQDALYKLGNNQEAKEELIRKWRAEFRANQLKDPKDLQAKADAKAIREAMKNVVNDNSQPQKNVGNEDKEDPTTNTVDPIDPTANEGTGENSTDPVANGDETRLEDMTVASLKAQAEEMGLEVSKRPTKAELIKAIEEALAKRDEE